MTPAARRPAVGYLKESDGLSERRACTLVGGGNSPVRYRGCRRHNALLRQRRRDLATERPRFGYRRLHVRLRREGFAVNHKRIYRLDRADRLTLRRRRRKCVADRRGEPSSVAIAPDQRRAVDFIGDALDNGRRFRGLSVLDVFTREVLAIAIDTSLTGRRVVWVLEQLARVRDACPTEIVSDNGPELTSRALDQWAYEHTIRLHFIDPGTPVQNASIESFEVRLRGERLNQHWYVSLADVRHIVQVLRKDYNRQRLHSALAYRCSEEFLFAFHQEAEAIIAPVGVSWCLDQRMGAGQGFFA